MFHRFNSLRTVSAALALWAGLGCQRSSEAQLGAVAVAVAQSPQMAAGPATDPIPIQRKIGVLLANHGSRSATWRQGLIDLETRVKPRLLADGRIASTRTAHMEYTEPSIASQLEAFDREGMTDIILVPVFLTVSPHSFDDIPTIIGQKVDPKSLETLRLEKIRQYKPKARVHMTQTLDFSGLLKQNVLRRAKALSQLPAEEGLVLIAYGDQTYDKEWSALLDSVGAHVGRELGIGAHSYGWCGHIAHYDPAQTTQAIEKVLVTRKKALVIPVLVAHDEAFQVKIIGDGIAKIERAAERVAYRPDAILPDPDIERWVEAAVAKAVAGIAESTAGKAP